MFAIRQKGAVFFTALFLFGCNSSQMRINKAFELAKSHFYEPIIIHTSTFPVQVFYKNSNTNHAVIYLEGDGLVLNKYGEVAIDPTPTDPMALRLACADERNFTKIVINRPFHYIKKAGLHSKYWTIARYSPEVIESIKEVIEIFQQKFQFKTLEFIAYSGGACVALLLAPKVKELQKIITFAGNLDHKSWTRYHQSQPLSLSLDPMKNAETLRKIPQIHFLGTDDMNTTVDLGLSFKKHLNTEKVNIIEIDGFKHDSNWPRIWKEQLEKLK